MLFSFGHDAKNHLYFKGCNWDRVAALQQPPAIVPVPWDSSCGWDPYFILEDRLRPTVLTHSLVLLYPNS
jgi:hypothetical protein